MIPLFGPLEFENGRGRRAATIVLGLLSIVLLFSMLPFVTGLLGAPVLYVMFREPYRRMVKHMPPVWAASVAVTLAFLLLLLPAAGAISLLAGELPGVLRAAASGELNARIASVTIGPIPVGAELRALTDQLLAWVTSKSVTFIGSATMSVINAIIALLGLWFLLLMSDEYWQTVRGWIPFSEATAERLRLQFHEVTWATVGGMLLTAVLQGAVVAGSFWLVGLPRALFWGIVTAFLSVLPILGSALVWGPGAVVLLVRHQPGAAITVALIGFIIASNIDNVAMLVLLKRVARIHPVVSIVGAFAGVHLIGAVGVLLGPLLLAYFLELVAAFQAEYRAAPNGERALEAALDPASSD